MTARAAEGVLDPEGRGWMLAREVAKVGICETHLRSLDEADWRPLLEAAGRDRLVGLLMCGLQTGEVTGPRPLMAAATELHRHALTHCLRLERALLEVVAELDANRVPVRVLKGVALAHLDYDSPSDRVFRDLDLLVPAADLDRSVAVLGSIGFLRTYAEPRPGFQRRFGKGVALRRADGVEVDLHHTLALGPLGLRIPEAELWRTQDGFRLGGTTISALDPTSRFLHACIHEAVSPGPRLWILRDVAQLHTHRLDDPDAAVRLATTWGVLPALVAAVRSTDEHLDHQGPLTSWAWGRQLSRSETVVLKAYETGRGELGRVLATLRTSRGIRTRAALVRDLLLPDKHYLEQLGTTRRRRALRAFAHLRRGHG